MDDTNILRVQTYIKDTRRSTIDSIHMSHLVGKKCEDNKDGCKNDIDKNEDNTHKLHNSGDSKLQRAQFNFPADLVNKIDNYAEMIIRLTIMLDEYK